MATQAKPWYKSTTLWINIAGVAAIVLDYVVKSNLIPDADVVAILVSVLNIINRLRPQLEHRTQSVSPLKL